MVSLRKLKVKHGKFVLLYVCILKNTHKKNTFVQVVREAAIKEKAQK